MNARPQITIAEPRIRMPAWRSASPKKWQDAPAEHRRAMTRAENLAMSPNEAIQSFGTSAQVLPVGVHPSSEHAARARIGISLMTEISGWVASRVCVKT